MSSGLRHSLPMFNNVKNVLFCDLMGIEPTISNSCTTHLKPAPIFHCLPGRSIPFFYEAFRFRPLTTYPRLVSKSGAVCCDFCVVYLRFTRLPTVFLLIAYLIRSQLTYGIFYPQAC